MKKSYYVDGHEHEDQKSHRSKFTQKYLTQLEPRSHRWVQMSMDNAEIIKLSLPAKDPLLVTGHIYVDPDTGVDHVEFHVNDHDCMQDFANTTNRHLVAMLASARLLTKSLLSSLDKMSQSLTNSHLAHRSG